MPALGGADDLVTDVEVDISSEGLVAEPEAEGVCCDAVEGSGETMPFKAPGSNAKLSRTASQMAGASCRTALRMR